MKVSEIFKSIQGEGKYTGYPSLFIRLSGCTRNCEWCDTKYHKNGFDLKEDDLLDRLKKYNKLDGCSYSAIIVWTGGEPLLQFEEIAKLRYKYRDWGGLIAWHLETNGDLIEKKVSRMALFDVFDYVVCSPKSVDVAKKIYNWHESFVEEGFEIKVVTDLDSVGVDMIEYADRLMPLSVKDEKENMLIRKKVWNYCCKNRCIYSDRLHVNVWGNMYGK